MSTNSARGGDSIEDYTSDTLNYALDALGLLSRVTDSRHQYLQEREQIFGRLEALSLSDRGLGASTAASASAATVMPHTPTKSLEGHNTESASFDSLQGCSENLPTHSIMERHNSFFPRLSNKFLLSSTMTADTNDSKNCSPVEKENSIFSGLKTLTINSDFFSSFSSYSLPGHLANSQKTRHSIASCGSLEKGKPWQKDHIRSFLRRKRFRSHPYTLEGSEKCSALFEMCVHSSERTSNLTGCYRLRTASLSSGVSGKNKKQTLVSLTGDAISGSDAVATGRPCYAVPGMVARSRSMEDLSAAAAADLHSTTADLHADVLRTREVENVSRAIQQMCVQDTG
ncbi:uncharacterized protein LOC108677191 isoform X2 [Hyalella azteca]|nr:uncharacterized protein LOC108677191 isoform X2 [Hyalella azteca]XP_047736879.1 uncharacterized protein LOC108677191 isoform X2 [Hyalella azteca]